jgi:hypothetical protein
MDLDKLSSDAKDRYARIGRSFGSERTLAQGLQTLVGLRAHSDVLADYGFAAEDVQDLEQAIGWLQDAGVGREGTIVQKKGNAVELLGLVKQGKGLRQRLRGLTTTVIERLGRTPSDDERALIAQLDAVLDQTDTSGAEPQKLIDQLKLLLNSFAHASFAGVASSRGGDALRQQVEAFIPKLQTAADTIDQLRGNPIPTARLDLIDGVIVELVRSARRAARGASDDLGRPELEQVFGLSELYDPT